MPSGYGGAAEEEERISAHARAVGEGLGVFLQRTPGGDQEEATSRATGGGGVRVGAGEETEWRRQNRVGGKGNSNAVVSTDG